MRAFIFAVKASPRMVARTRPQRGTSTSHLSSSQRASKLVSQFQGPRTYSTINTPGVPLLKDEDLRKKQQENQAADNTAADVPFYLPVRPDSGKQNQKPKDSEEKSGKEGFDGGAGEEQGEGSGLFEGDEDFELPGLDDFLPDVGDIF